jgi:hypothetical protein
MDKITIDNLKVRPDQKTGKKPTTKQLQLLCVLNPFRRRRKVTYAEAAALLGISVSSVNGRMSNFKHRCPELHKNFDVVRYPKKYREVRHVHKTGCVDCGTPVPENQKLCFGCWRIRDRKYNPHIYKQDKMFPKNGRTCSTIDWDKWEDNDYHWNNQCRHQRRSY